MAFCFGSVDDGNTAILKNINFIYLNSSTEILQLFLSTDNLTEPIIRKAYIPSSLTYG